MGGVVDAVKTIIGGGSGNKEAKEAARQRRESLKQQEAVNARARLREDKRAEDLSGQDASRRRAIQARRRGTASLAFTGARQGLKSTFGG